MEETHAKARYIKDKGLRGGADNEGSKPRQDLADDESGSKNILLAADRELSAASKIQTSLGSVPSFRPVIYNEENGQTCSLPVHITEVEITPGNQVGSQQTFSHLNPTSLKEI